MNHNFLASDITVVKLSIACDECHVVNFHLLSTMSLNEGMCSASSLGHFNPGKQAPVPIQKDAV
jgi:hypothetical protein